MAKINISDFVNFWQGKHGDGGIRIQLEEYDRC